MYKKKHTYVLGTGLSHDGSACLLKDGEICVAIEKERLTRRKHDGFNDTLAINYCLQAEGITVNDLDLVVQSALQGGNFEVDNSYFGGSRIFTADVQVPVITISHHLAHAYSTVGRCPFKEDFNVLIIDGSGSTFADCIDVKDVFIPGRVKICEEVSHLFHEKDSYYTYTGEVLKAVYKDFSPSGPHDKSYAVQPCNLDSIGGVYEGVSSYCFTNGADTGKLMGLAPYGSPGAFEEEVFFLKDGRVFVNYAWIRKLRTPARSFENFKANFKYYADIAFHVQAELERAVLYLVRERAMVSSTGNLCYAGGVALNAVANNLIAGQKEVNKLYIQPAAGDNGISIGCAYYGWLVVLGKERRPKENSSTCFGITYTDRHIENVLCTFDNRYSEENLGPMIRHLFTAIESNYVPERIESRNAVIELGIKGHSKHQIIVRDGRIVCEMNGCLTPSSKIELNTVQLAGIMQDPGYFGTLFEANKIGVSNPDEIKWFTQLVDFYKILESDLIGNGTVKNPIRDKFEYASDFIERTATLLAEGNVIAWFQGGSEFGPRALGRRSILADPRIPGIRDYINREIKLREDFRPFAPAVLREDVGIFFKGDRESPYMILVDYVREEWRDKIGSVVHKNSTSRVQTVTPEWNLDFCELLKAFKRLTGISVLVNTSLNRRGMPIVESPQDALDFFYSGKLNYLVMGKFIIGK